MATNVRVQWLWLATVVAFLIGLGVVVWVVTRIEKVGDTIGDYIPDAIVNVTVTNTTALRGSLGALSRQPDLRVSTRKIDVEVESTREATITVLGASIPLPGGNKVKIKAPGNVAQYMIPLGDFDAMRSSVEDRAGRQVIIIESPEPRVDEHVVELCPAESFRVEVDNDWTGHVYGADEALLIAQKMIRPAVIEQASQRGALLEAREDAEEALRSFVRTFLPPQLQGLDIEIKWTRPPASTPTAQSGAATYATAVPVLFAPRGYDCQSVPEAPIIDGNIDDKAWAIAPWTDDFLDIQGPSLPKPRFRTRAKMLWDSKYLYIAAELEEPHVWANLTKHDEIVFHDNDFEVFIDPDGDTLEYYELEVNALGTIFDLYLHQRYKEGGPAEHAWNAAGLKTAIRVNGTVNSADDRDFNWTVEWAIPFSSFAPPQLDLPSHGERARAAKAPSAGDTWRLNFSRVQWHHRLSGKLFGAPPREIKYLREEGVPEDNWVWSPQWQIDMHDPQFWGKVTFRS